MNDYIRFGANFFCRARGSLFETRTFRLYFMGGWARLFAYQLETPSLPQTRRLMLTMSLNN